MRVAIGQTQRSLAEPSIRLPQLDAVPGGEPDQNFPAAMIETRIQRMRDRLRLHGGVHADTFEAARLHCTRRHRRLHGHREQQLHALRADALAPARERARIDRQPVLQIVEAAEELPIRVLDPALAQLLVREVVGVLEIAETDHQPCRFAGTTGGLVIERPERGLETLPLDQSRQTQQRMPEVQLVGQSCAKQVVGVPAVGVSWAHHKSPENCGAESDFRYFRILASARESLIYQRIMYFSGPTK